MNTKEIFMIVLLLVILAILYKLMQGMKYQTELTTGIAIKAGVPLPKKNKKPKIEEEYEEEYEEEQEEQEEEEDDEKDEEDEEDEVEEVEAQEEDEKGTPIVRDLDKPTKLIKINPPKREVEKPKGGKKLKTYQKLAMVITDYPLPIKDLTEKYEEEFGDITKKELWKALSYATIKGVIKKHLVSENPNRYIYATPEMYDGEELKQEYKS